MLRGINVGGKNLIKMEALKLMYTNLGFINVQTYIQSGNVIFQTNSTDATILATTISKKITDTFGLQVPLIIKDAIEFQEIVENNLFLSRKNINTPTLHITFLSSSPLPHNLIKITQSRTPISTNNDEFVMNADVIYLHCPNGYGNSKLTNSFWENKLKVTATTRNVNTCMQLLNMAIN